MLKQRFWVSQKHFIYKEKCGSHKRKINYDNLKSDTPFKNICFICLNKNPLKTIKNVYFILKALFILRFFGHIKNGLLKKTSLISKLMTSQPGS